MTTPPDKSSPPPPTTRPSTPQDAAEDDDLIVFWEDEKTEAAPLPERAASTPDDVLRPSAHPSPWTLLVVDDDPSVLAITRLALQGLTVDGAPLVLLEAFDAAEARAVLASRPDVALVLTDVVMEDEQAGLELVRWIRTQPHLEACRLVIRTGQPGRAPELQVLQELDINDYWPKTEMTAHRMRTLLVGLVRSYRDLRRLERKNRELHRLMLGLGELVSSPGSASLVAALARTLEHSTRLQGAAVLFVDKALAQDASDAPALAGTGPYADSRGATLGDLTDPAACSALEESERTRRLVQRDGWAVLFLPGTRNHGTAFVATDLSDRGEWAADLLSVLCTNALALINNHREQAERARLAEAAYRFVPEGLVQWLGHEDLTELSLGEGVTTRAWVLFFDLQGFTARSETLAPDAVLSLLLSAFQTVVPAIERHGGVVDKFLGDGLMALFPGDAPPPLSCLDEIASGLADLRTGLRAGIGLHGGDVVLCTVGHESRIDVTALADTVNVASRIEHLTRELSCDILVSEAVAAGLRGDPEAQARLVDQGAFHLRGRTATTRLYALAEPGVRVARQDT